jgi:hypothetical protein
MFSFINLSKFLRSFINAEIKEGEHSTSPQSYKIQAAGSSNNNDHVHRKWNDTEHQMLIKAYYHHGEKWDMIAQCIRGRSAKECKEEIKDFWVVEKFVNHRPASETKGYWELRTRWVGWSSEDDTWEPINEKYNEVPDLVQKYVRCNPEVFIRQSSKRNRDDQGNIRSIKRANCSHNVEDEGQSFIQFQTKECTSWMDAELNTLVSMKDMGKNWKQTSKAVSKVGLGRTPKACQTRFWRLNEDDKMQIRNEQNINRFDAPKWSDAELHVLVSSRENQDDWDTVSAAVSRVRYKRSLTSCYKKYHNLTVEDKERILKRAQS